MPNIFIGDAALNDLIKGLLSNPIYRQIIKDELARADKTATVHLVGSGVGSGAGDGMDYCYGHTNSYGDGYRNNGQCGYGGGYGYCSNKDGFGYGQVTIVANKHK